MNIGQLYYLGGISEGLSVASCILAVIILIGSAFVTFTLLSECKSLAYHDDDDEDDRAFKKGIRIGWVSGLVLTIMAIVLPTQKAVVAMYIVPKIENNERIQIISDKALDRIERILDCDLNGKTSGCGKNKEDCDE